MIAARYAIYFAPEVDDPLWRFGCTVLGYDPVSCEAVASPPAGGLAAAEWSALIAEPARYGFHATLKAPFVPAEGLDETTVVAAIDAFAASRPAFSTAPLQVAVKGRHVALVPGDDAVPLNDLADACVAELDELRAPMSEADLARRMAAGLTSRQEIQLRDYGYPFIFDDFRFHMTLAGPCEAGVAEMVRDDLANRLQGEVSEHPLRVASLCLFAEPRRGDRFRLIHRAQLQ